MIKKILSVSLCLVCISWSEAQYISEVVEYTPAPGQYINTVPWGNPGAAASIVGGVNGSMCLGAFGGYVVFRFEHPVENHPDNPYGVDFTIFGNPMTDWSEPGAVWVMKDDNENGLPDDTWYELAGSEYYFSSTRKNYRVTYTNPGDTMARDVPWIDHMGNSGIVRTNSAHTQTYYPLHDSFPSVPEERYTLAGTLIKGAVDLDHPPLLKSFRRAFGYADNQLRGQAPFTLPDNPYTPEVENSGGDAFDIDWAVDSSGVQVELDRVDFIKVQNAMQNAGGWLGELSTEVTGAVDVAPDPSVTGRFDLIVIRDLPLLIETESYQLEAFVFRRGKLQLNETLKWTTSHEGAAVDGNLILRVTHSGPLSLTASLVRQPHIQASVFTQVELDQATFLENKRMDQMIQIYPNPAGDFFRVTGVGDFFLTLFESGGKMLIGTERYQEGSEVDISTLPQGFYMVRVDQGIKAQWFKLLKK